MTPEELHRKKLKELGYKDKVIEELVLKYITNCTYEFAKAYHTEQLNLCAVSSCLTLKEVASKYGEKVKCMFYDYDDNWKEKTMIVDSSFLKDMEKGAIKDCC